MAFRRPLTRLSRTTTHGLKQPILLWLFFYSTPGVLNPPEAADYWTARAKDIETVYIGNGMHYVQEDHPYLIGRAISDWYRRLEARQ